MNPKTNNQDSPLETEVQPAPVVDVAELFQKDPEPTDDGDNSLKAKLMARFTKNNILIATVLATGLLMGGGLIYAGFNPATDQPWSPEYTEDLSESYDEEMIPTEEGEGEGEMVADLGEDVPLEGFDSEIFEEPVDVPEEYIIEEEVYVEPEDPIVVDPPQDDDVVVPNQKTYTVSYANKCYSPATLTIKKGEAVMFKNNSNRDMWPASDNHPSHALYPEFDATGTISPDDSYTFTFLKVGVWGYHDHLKPNCSGTITVQP